MTRRGMKAGSRTWPSAHSTTICAPTTAGPPTSSFDPGAFAADLEDIVVEPLEEVEQLFAEKPYLTRLYTTLSADEMTVDPMFAYNPDLPQVANIRFAGARWDCGGSQDTPLEQWELIVTLSDGREVRSRPFADGDRPFPASRRPTRRCRHRAAPHLRSSRDHPPPHRGGNRRHRGGRPGELGAVAELSQPLQPGQRSCPSSPRVPLTPPSTSTT